MFPSSAQTVLALALAFNCALALAQSPNCPDATFFKTWGNENLSETGTALAKSADGNLYVAGRKVGRTYIHKVSPSGKTIWFRDFQIGPFDAVAPAQIFEDSEGMIVGCGTQSQFAGASRGLVFRYDPIANTVLWAKFVASSAPRAAGILEKTPSGSYVYYQNLLLPDGSTDYEVLDLARSTGDIIQAFARRYEYFASDGISKMVTVGGSLYGLGWSQFDSLSAARRLVLARYNPVTGVPIWARWSHLALFSPADFLSRDLAADGSYLISAYVVRSDAAASSPYRVFLQKNDLDGGTVWVKGYDIEAVACRVLVVPDGYVVSGQDAEGNHFFVMKTDKNGAPVWANRLSYGPPSNVNAEFAAPELSAFIADSLYFTGTATSGLSDVLFWKMLANGSMLDSCAYVESIAVKADVVDMPSNEPIDLKHIVSTAVATQVGFAWSAGDIAENMVCPNCTVPDPCPERNDFVVKMSAIACSAGKINLQMRICDLDGGELPALSVSFYNANPFTEAADRLEVYEYAGGPDSCVTVSLSDLVNLFGANAVQNGLTLYAVVNDPGSGLTPFDIGDFPFSDLEECDYANNLDSLTIELPSAPALNLGPDLAICAGEDALLDAGAGFFRYQWSNGASTQTTSVSFAGQYRVTVTDFCGFRQFDTVQVAIRPVPLVTESASFCPGKSVTVRGFTFDQAGTFQRTIPGIGGDCDTVGTFFITQLPYEERIQVVNFCPYQSVTINGVEYFDSGLVRDTVESAQGCDTIVFYFLNQLPLPFRTFLFDICPGESVVFNGNTYSQNISFVDTLYSTGFGCDTIAYVTVTLLPAPTREETLAFCPGETVTVNGQVYTQPEVVQFTVPGTAGECDTLVTVYLQYEAPMPSTAALSCPPSISVSAVPGAGPVPITYPQPSASTDCNCPGMEVELQAGMASGGLFPVGITQVCYKTQDYCGSTATCCFTVTVLEEQACDVKAAGCVRYELLDITANSKQEKTYRIRVTNNCASKLVYTAVQIPAGTTAVEPANLSTYLSPDGRSYAVRNPNYSPFYSVRFKPLADGISGGESDVLEYTLPAQAQVSFINITTRLANQTFAEAKLNTFNCLIGSASLQQRDEPKVAAGPLPPPIGLALYPNPTRGELFADLSAWQGQRVQWRVMDSRGALVYRSEATASAETQVLPTGAKIPPGMYFIEIQTETERRPGRFILGQ